ncbi:MAG: hypothetical protein CMM93_03950 [Rickettsiales bacterium]|nr:hypothetical protein [Rickettsiales bacterium]|tara:strand:+ start:2164 stop:2427 length:264 start_codon:yes stop_codon:yes gene_type:complete
MRIVIFLALMMTPIAAQAMVIKGDYHERMFEKCKDVAGYKCCRASVHQMRAENAQLKEKDKDCPYGKVPKTLSCPASLTWCGYKDKD